MNNYEGDNIMKSMQAYYFKIYATHEKYGKSVAEHYIMADDHNEAKEHIQQQYKDAGWTIRELEHKAVNIFDIRG